MKTLFFLILLLISYGSLYPFDFSMVDVGPDSLQILFQTWDSYTHPGDILANVVLFVPLGLTGVLMLTPNLKTNAAIFNIMLVGLVLGVILQLAQIYMPSRDANLSDAVLNVIGTAIGSLAACGLNTKKLPFFNLKSQFSSFPVLLLSSWLAYRLMPFIPSIDLQEIKNSIKPLLLYPEWDLIRIFHDCTAWLAAFYFFSRVFQNHSIRYFAALILTCFALEIFIVNNAVSLSNIAGAFSAFVLWCTIFARLRHAAALLAIMTAVMLVLSKLAPFQQAYEPHTFHWLPFHGFLGGSMLVNTSSLFEKFFLYGALIWLLKDSALRLWMATLITVGVTLSIEVAQIYYEAHLAEITDPLLVIMIGLLASAIQAEKDIPDNFDKQFQCFSVKIFLNSPVLSQPIKEECFTSDFFPIYFGRYDEKTDNSSTDCHRISLTDNEPYQLSRSHFSIEQIGDNVVIRDLDSTLGTLVNGKQIGKKSINQSKKLKIGENKIIAGQPHSNFYFRILVEPV